MAMDNSQNSFRRGVMSMVILSLLKREDMYGYQLVQETERSSGGKLTTQEGSLYPVLYKLLDQGLISDRKVLVGKRMQRVYYHLEPEGEQRLRELIQEYEDVTTGVFQIIKEAELCEGVSSHAAVPGADLVESAGELGEETADPISVGGARPGLCF